MTLIPCYLFCALPRKRLAFVFEGRFRWGLLAPGGAVSTVILNTLLPPRRKHLKIRDNWPLGLDPIAGPIAALLGDAHDVHCHQQQFQRQHYLPKDFILSADLGFGAPAITRRRA